MLYKEYLQHELDKWLQEQNIDFHTQPGWVDFSKELSFGDYSTTLPLNLAKILKKSPGQIANSIVPALSSAFFEKIEATPNGYINFFLHPDHLIQQLREANADPIHFLSTTTGAGKKVLIEYVSCNPTGPITVANARGGPIGDTIANMYTLFGYHTEREFYVNDMGSKIRKLAESVFYHIQLKLNGSAALPEEFYPGEYVQEIAEAYLQEDKPSVLTLDRQQAITLLSQYSLEFMLRKIFLDLDDLHIHFTQIFRESELHKGYLAETIQLLTDKGATYQQEGALWFRSTQFGDDKDRVLLRKDGSPTYLAGDISYHRNKFERGYDRIVDIWGADQSHQKPLKFALRLLGFDEEKLLTVVFQLVHLFKDGQELKMSKSTGAFISLRELIDEIGPDVTRFIYLTRSHDQHLNFDVETTKSHDPKNPVFYAQYAFTRCKGILREARDKGLDLTFIPDTLTFTDQAETDLIRKIAHLPDKLFRAFELLSPHLITMDLIDLGNTFHLFYEHCRVVDLQNPETSQSRIFLVQVLVKIMTALFQLLGIDTPERM
ncbi:arginine--tRNA ligase [bacterium]|nr:arginine--tRNA ligase [bacterium]